MLQVLSPPELYSIAVGAKSAFSPPLLYFSWCYKCWVWPLHLPHTQPSEPVHCRASSRGRSSYIELSEKKTLNRTFLITLTNKISYLNWRNNFFFTKTKTNQVTAPLSTHVVPPYLVTDFGKTATFNCSIDGFPVLNVFWLKVRGLRRTIKTEEKAKVVAAA